MLESCTKEKQESAESKVLLESHEFIRGRIQYQNHDQIGMTLQSHEAVCQAVETKIRMRLKRQ